MIQKLILVFFDFLLTFMKKVTNTQPSKSLHCASLAPPLRRAGEGERAEESGDTAIQSIALSTDLSVPIRLIHTCGNNFVM